MNTPIYRKNGASKATPTTSPTKTRPPRNKEARKAYYEHYGKLLAQDAIWERKSSQFGGIFKQDKFSRVRELPDKKTFSRSGRNDTYKKAMDLYENSELIRPIINLFAAAVFSKNNGTLDLRGTSAKLKELAFKIVDHNELNFHDLTRDLELSGDLFLSFKENGDQTEIFSTNPGITSVITVNGDMRRVVGFTDDPLTDDTNLDPKQVKFPITTSQHLKINSTAMSLYGRSSLSHLIYWVNVLDNLFEGNWLRGAQYYGDPLIVISGVPGPYQQAVQTQIENQSQRAGRSWILPPDTKVDVPDFTLGFPIGDIVAWVFRMISIGSEIPITLLGTADVASRGSAFFSNPRFNLAIHPRREVWRIGLRAFFIKIFKAIGVVDQNQVLSRKEFDVGFLPIFDKDLEDLADVIEIYRSQKMISKKSAREMIGLDHDDEEKFMEEEPDEEVLPTTQQQTQLTREKRHLKRKRKSDKLNND